MKQTVRFRVDFTTGCSIGPGKVALLEGIRDTGSLRQAARALGMSYRRAWLLLDELNHSFTAPATTATVGGAGGGGAQLTTFGETLIHAYRSLERDIESLAHVTLATIAARAKARPGPKARRPPSEQRRRLSRAPSPGPGRTD
jgi:molybdate transport system regulatory protein